MMTPHGQSQYICSMVKPKKRRVSYRIYSHYLDRMEALIESEPHQTHTDFLETALHREILRREAEARVSPVTHALPSGHGPHRDSAAARPIAPLHAGLFSPASASPGATA